MAPAEETSLDIRVLGPLELHVGDRVYRASRRQEALVLAALTVDAGRSVSVDALMDRVWQETTPPPQARRTLHSHITRLRRLLDQVRAESDVAVSLARRDGGYLLEVDPTRVDLHRFRLLVQRAREPRRTDDERAALLRAALDLWHGEPLAGMSGAWAAWMRETWLRQRLDAVVAWGQAELRAGDPNAVVETVRELAGEHVLLEPLTAVLMRALAATGNTAEALRHYAAIRERLTDELGVEPGPELRHLHEALLHDDVARSPATTAPRPGRGIAAQLPAAVVGFAGRRAELAELDRVMAAAGGRPATVVVSAVSGTAGVGKTALAVHWAHRVADRFGDGQLYVNLRGFDPGGRAVRPREALTGFLDALGVAPERMPDEVDALAALYRSVVAGRRMLIVLDNARDVEQVRPLLPGAPGCLVVVTSRDRLSGLVAIEGAQPVSLDLLPTDEARQLLANRLGAGEVGTEPRAAEAIIASCARLPLALAIAAARARQAGLGLHALADELRDGLDAFAGDDHATDVRAVFSWSYHALSAEAARLFRLLAVHPGPDIAVPAAASLAGVPVRQVRPWLAELTRAHLVTEHPRGRYACHDLLRAYAGELARDTDTDADRRQVTHRVLDHYLHTAHAAALRLYAHRDTITVAAAQPGTTPEELADQEQTMAWFTAEHQVLLAAIRHATRTGFDTHAWQLAWCVDTFLQRRGHASDRVVIQQTALAAAERQGDRSGQAYAHRSLATGHALLGNHDDALNHYQHALDLYREIDDPSGQAHTHLRRSILFERQGRNDQALRDAEQALDLYRRTDHGIGVADALNAMGWYHTLLGNHHDALDYCQQALALHQKMRHRYGEATTWDSLGYVHHQLGDHQRATTCYEQAIAIFRSVGARDAEAETLTHLGDTHHAAGERTVARDAWRDALAIFVELDHPDADGLRGKLDQVAGVR